MTLLVDIKNVEVWKNEVGVNVASLSHQISSVKFTSLRNQSLSLGPIMSSNVRSIKEWCRPQVCWTSSLNYTYRSLGLILHAPQCSHAYTNFVETWNFSRVCGHFHFQIWFRPLDWIELGNFLNWLAIAVNHKDLSFQIDITLLSPNPKLSFYIQAGLIKQCFLGSRQSPRPCPEHNTLNKQGWRSRKHCPKYHDKIIPSPTTRNNGFV